MIRRWLPAALLLALGRQRQHLEADRDAIPGRVVEVLEVESQGERLAIDVGRLLPVPKVRCGAVAQLVSPETNQQFVTFQV